jgi:hypothetical protein
LERISPKTPGKADPKNKFKINNMAKQTKKDFTALSKPSLADKLERTEKNKPLMKPFLASTGTS